MGFRLVIPKWLSDSYVQLHGAFAENYFCLSDARGCLGYAPPAAYKALNELEKNNLVRKVKTRADARKRKYRLINSLTFFAAQRAPAKKNGWIEEARCQLSRKFNTDYFYLETAKSQLHASDQAVYKIINELERANLVTKVRDDGDKRRKKYALTLAALAGVMK